MGHQDRKPGTRRRGRLPQGVEDELRRAAPKDSRQAAVNALEKATAAFAAGNYEVAVREADRVKGMVARSEAARELLGLGLYRMQRWRRALSELRHLRRMSGDPTHVAVEMDCLRALGRSADVEKLWHELAEWEPSPQVRKEAAVVFASHLLEEGRAADAWKVVNPKRLPKQASEQDLRQWYVASRVAHALGDDRTARQLLEAIANRDPSLPGLAELRREIADDL